MAKNITRLFDFELVESWLNKNQDDYLLTVLVTEKSTGRKDTYVYSMYWEKAEPEHGYFNHYEIDPSVSYFMEFSDHVRNHIRIKYKKVLDKGDQIMLEIDQNKVDAFINSI